MRRSGRRTERLLHLLDHVDVFMEHVEKRQPERHVRGAVKEWLLASRAVLDSVIDTVESIPEEEKGPPRARKVEIAKE